MLRIFYRPPFIGLFAVLLIILLQAIGHTHMVLVRRAFGEESLYWVVGAEGLIGAALVLAGSKIGDEVWATWLGFFGGMNLFNGWVEFSFVYYANRWVGPGLAERGIAMTKPEYLIMPSSLGIVLAIGIYFVLNRETKCNAFRWLHKNLGLNVGVPTPGYKRNFATITAVEYVSIAWFFYMVLLLLYDRKILGDRHPVTYASFFLFLVWALYLTPRLLKYTRATAALRYAIPTAAVWWSCIELLGRWGVTKEIWLHPQDYKLEMALILGAFLVFVLISIAAARNREREAPAG